MSLNSIVKISISTQNLQMAQAGFGIPLIIATHDYWAETVRTFSSLSEMLKTQEGKENDLAEDEKFHKQPLYEMAQAIFSQNPSVPKIKIGKRGESESVTVALENISKNDANGDFYGVLLLTDKPAEDFLELADAISDKRLLAGVDLEIANKEIAESLKKSYGARRIFSILKENALKPEDPKNYPAAAWMGRMLSQPPGSSSWAFKELNGVTKSKLSSNTDDELQKSNINRHIDINKVGVTLDGKVASGEYIDIVHGIDWLHVRIQERLFRLLMINEKIPYTAKGVDLVRSEILAQLKEAVYRGLLAAEPEPQVSIPNIEDITVENRGKRILPDVRFSGRLAGAIHEIVIEGKVGP